MRTREVMILARTLTAMIVPCRHPAVIGRNADIALLFSSRTGCRRRRSLAAFDYSAARAFSTTSGNQDNARAQHRQAVLARELELLGLDAVALHAAHEHNCHNPTAGYDPRYGKPAIKTYRAFVLSEIDHDLATKNIPAVARRVARHIDFLRKRHQAHSTSWVRHHDGVPNDATNAAPKSSFPLLLILDNVRSAANVGSIWRTADACGCAGVWTCGLTPHPNGAGAEKVQKCSLGAELVVPGQHYATTRLAIECLRTTFPAYTLIGLETTARSVLYTDYTYPKLPENRENATTAPGVAVVLGNEVTGVDVEHVLPYVDAVVEIPMFGRKNSLNVAVCVPVILYEILRQWKVRV